MVEIAILNTPKKLLLTHINPLEADSDPVELDLIRQQLEAETVIAQDGMEIEF